MNYDEFAFFNQQLAGMLKAGIPLEGALRRLAETMAQGRLRAELEALGSDLTKGVPLREALPQRALPQVYVAMVRAGVEGNNLPGILTMLADYYLRLGVVWRRLKSLMVYPLIVYGSALAIFGFITWLLVSLAQSGYAELEGWVRPSLGLRPWSLWLPLGWLTLAGLLLGALILVPQGRAWLSWKLPGFKEAHLARLSATLKLLLESGSPLPQALDLARQMEGDNRVGAELGRWQQRLAGGEGKLAQVARGGSVFPPLFVWLISHTSEDPASGFARAAELYYERAKHRIEMMLYAALPVAVLALGGAVVGQTVPLVQMLVLMLNTLGGGDALAGS
ncbi:MAG: hypothetical protein FJ387_20215 [Verrucomicrobia bacterium]|nr:hypothetical protein [Verrucomicrobiota bacterium]